jgi:hypothetical protein
MISAPFSVQQLLAKNDLLLSANLSFPVPNSLIVASAFLTPPILAAPLLKRLILVHP